MAVVKFYEDVFGMTEMLHFTDEADLDRVLRADVEGRHQRQRPREVPDQRARRGESASRRSTSTSSSTAAPARSTSPSPRDIVKTVTDDARARDPVPDRARTYYDDVPERIGEIEESLEDLRRLGILVDRDDEATCRIFTKPVGDRPTMFFQVIERHGARGFGGAEALFEAIEREQELRGTCKP